METWVRFNAQSQAKERLLRAAQYTCTLCGDALLRSGANPALIDRVKRLEAHLGVGRKLLRLGSSADALDAAKRSIHLSDAVLRFCITLSHLNRAVYLACDNVLWAGKVGLLPNIDQQKWGHRAFRYYLFTLLLNLSRDAYEIRQLMEREWSGRRSSSSKGCGSERGHAGLQRLRVELRLLLRVLRGNPPLLLDLLRNVCDLCIPLERLGLLRCGAAVLGLCGISSSVLGIVTILHPWLRLKP